MSLSRKCSNCRRWNTDHDYCVHCGAFLNHDSEIREKELVQIKRNLELNTDRMDKLIERLRQSDTFVGRLAYYVVRSMWYVAVIFLTFIYALIALIAG